MPVQPHGLAVMKYTSHLSTTHGLPAPRPLTTLVVTLGLLATVFAVLVAVSHPVAALVTIAATLTLAGVVRTLRRRRLRRKTARTVCVPHTGVCLRV